MAKALDDSKAPKRLCNSRRPNSDERCRLPAGYRTEHLGYGACYRHGGASPNAMKAALKVKAAEAVVTFGLPREIDPKDALVEELWRTAGHVSWLEARVRELDPNALIWGTVKETSEGLEGVPPFKRSEEAAVASIWLKLYREERQHFVEVSKVAIACGIAERQIKLAEDHGRLIAQVISGVLGELGVDQQETNVRTVVRKHLMLVSGDSGT